MHQRGTHAHRKRHLGIERRDQKLFVKHQNKRKIKREHRSENPHRTRSQIPFAPEQAIPGRVRDLSVKHAFLIEIDLPGISRDQNNPQREQCRKSNAYRRVFLHAPPAVKCLNQHRGNHPTDSGANKHRNHIAAARNQKRNHNTRQNSMA